MDSTTENLFSPASGMTKLEAVAVDLFARQYDWCAEEYRNDYLEKLSGLAIEAAAVILTRLDEYQKEKDPARRPVEKARAKIVRLIEEKSLRGSPLTQILTEQYGIDDLSLISPDEEIDLAAYLETI
jgi:hypothetical protein